MQVVAPVLRRFPWALVTALLVAGCSGNGCSCVEPTPGGFPDEERTSNAIQVRVSNTGLAALESDPATLVGGLLGTGGSTSFDVPTSCSGDPQICCSGGNPVTPCGPIDIDLVEQAGDAPRLEINPIAGQDRIDIVVRARVSSATPIAINYQGTDCSVTVDSNNGNTDDLTLPIEAQLSQDSGAGTTRIDISLDTSGNLGLENADVSLSGGVLCFLADVFLKGTIIDTLVGQLEGPLLGSLNDALCKSCDSGDVADCGPHADACESNVCMSGGQCLQEIGLAGRMGGASLLGGFSPGTGGKMDVYEVLGGYATTEQGGIALGMLSGMLPAGAERDRCGPPADPPADVSIAQSSFFQGNTRPDTDAPFHVALGVHQHNLDMAAWAAYDGGLLCLNIGTRTIDLLTSETLAVLMPSFIELLHGNESSMVLGLRPQSPPTITLGPGTFTPEGDIDEALLDVFFDNLEIDFFGMVDDQYIRLMTLTADVALPVSLDVDENGDILPVLGDVENAFTEMSVTNSEALAETPAELEAKIPAVLSLALPLIGDGLSAIAVPEIGGLQIAIQDGGITSIEDNTYLAIFADFVVGAAAPAPFHIDTSAEIVHVSVPSTAAFSAPTLNRDDRPTIELALGGTASDGSNPELEWSWRLDGGMWSPYTRRDHVVLDRASLWLQGAHTVDVRARAVGMPDTADPTPITLRPMVDTLDPRVSFRAHDDRLTIEAHDNASGSDVTVQYRWPDGDWHEAHRAPVELELEGRDPKGLEVRVIDQVGNTTDTSPAVIGFHGTASGSGCNCDSSGELPGGGAAMLAALVGLCLLGRRRLSAILRRGRRAAGAAALIAIAGALPGCSCGGTDTNVCSGPGGECIDGEVERGPTGRWDDIAVGERTVVSAYEELNGDLLLVELNGEDLSYRVVDGVPTTSLPVFDPSTYRGGIVEPGPNVGAWTSIALQNNLARIAYQDLDAGTLKFAEELDATSFANHVVDADTGGGRVGDFASLAYDSGGVPSIAYMAVNLDDTDGGKKAELRYARASGANPGATSAWTVSVIDSAPISCAGLCGAGDVCVAGDREVCAAETSDCAADCGSQACVAGACVDVVADPPAYDLPGGVGLFADLAFLPDGRAVVVYYDRGAGDLVMQVGGGDAWTRVDLDASPDTDTGMFSSLAIGGDGTVHVAYQDALGDQLMYTSWVNDTQGPIEVVDDGTRSGDRTHSVGASASVVVTGSGQVAIAYQDGATSDLVLATRSDSTWTRSDLLTGATLDGFYVSAAAGAGAARIASYRYDRSYYPPGELVITTIP